MDFDEFDILNEDFSEEVYCWQVNEVIYIDDASQYLKQDELGCIQCSNYNYCALSRGLLPQRNK